MTNTQKTVVESLRSQGLGYKRIAAQTGISANTVKSYLRKIAPLAVEQATPDSIPESRPKEAPCEKHICRYCGTSVEQNPGRKEKKFCSDSCRIHWWNTHPDAVDKKAFYDFTCACCGKPFRAYGNSQRKYCCHACYVQARFQGGDGHD